MARRIVILAQRAGSGKETEVDVAFWLDQTIVSRRPFYAGDGSQVIDASQAELDAITSGAVVERVRSFARPEGATNAQVKTFLEARYAEDQATLVADATYRLSGTFWDGTAWTNVVNDA